MPNAPHLPTQSSYAQEPTSTTATFPSTKSETVSDSEADEHDTNDDEGDEEPVDVESCDKTAGTESTSNISYKSTDSRINDSGVSLSLSPSASSQHTSSFTSIHSLLQK